MNCPGCTAGMERLALEGQAGTTIEIDLCAGCQVFWFDTRESLQLSPGSILRLFTRIGDASSRGKTGLSSLLKCPRCGSHLGLAHDQQRNTPFQYWRCPHAHGRLITFFQFLREKDFIRPLSKEQLAELKRNVQSVNCSNCGATIDLGKESACAHCGTALSILDLEQMDRVVAQLRRASEPQPVDPALPLELARARREVEASFESDGDWWRGADRVGVVEASLGALADWLRKSKF